MKRIGIVYHSAIDEAVAFARELERVLSSQQVLVWLAPAHEEGKIKPLVPGTDLVLSLGGDGTILRSARAVVPHAIPILGINLGRLGFMAEVSPQEVKEHLDAILSGAGWVDERAMLETVVAGTQLYALNDVFMARGAVTRVVHIAVRLDGEVLTTYKADGVIVASATGSTGYALAAGGPIIYPQSRSILLQPISSHPGPSTALVLPPDAVISLELTSRHPAMLSIDGQIDFPVNSGEKIQVKRSTCVTRFLRLGSPFFFYKSLGQRLGGRL